MPYKEKARQRASEKRYFEKNRDVIMARRALNGRNSRQKLKEAAYIKLGNCCNNRECKWTNEDGSIGCRDRRCLQLDHVLGQGAKERAKGIMGHRLYRDVLRDTSGKYQLLCANCNWIKRTLNKEFSSLWYTRLIA